MLKAKKVTEFAVTTSWPTWIHFEQFAAIHNVPYATEADGFKGLDTKLLVNSAPFVRNLQRLLDMAKAGTFKYAGRDNLPDPVFYSGQAAIAFNSSASRGALVKTREVPLRRGLSSLRPRDHQKADQLDHRRRQPLDDDGAAPHARGIQGASPRSTPSWASRRRTPTGPRPRATCR